MTEFVGFVYLVAGGFIGWWLKHAVTLRSERRAFVRDRQREAVSRFLELWQQRRSDGAAERPELLGAALNDLVLWCPDDALFHLGEYLGAFGTEAGREHFGLAVLSARRGLGLRPRWWRGERATAAHVVALYAASEQDAVD